MSRLSVFPTPAGYVLAHPNTDGTFRRGGLHYATAADVHGLRYATAREANEAAYGTPGCLYAAFGAALSAEAMIAACPSAREVGPFVLNGHALTVSAEGFVYPTPAAGHRVHGVLWNLEDEDDLIGVLDTFEPGAIDRSCLCYLDDGRVIPARMFVHGGTGGTIGQDVAEIMATEYERRGWKIPGGVS